MRHFLDLHTTAPEALAGIKVEEPTVSVDVMVNSSPFAGREGKYVTSRQVRDRLFRELESNVALRVEETGSPDTVTVSGRGELHLGILMETMRREGYEFAISRPRVILRRSEAGERLEPYEEVTIDVPETLTGAVIEKLGQRGGEMLEMRNPGGGLVRLVYRMPARGLFGYRSEFLTDTRGEGILHHRFLEYGPYVGAMSTRSRGVLVSMVDGEAVGATLSHPHGQLLGSLNGSGSFAVAEGVLQGIDLEALIDDDLSGSTVQNISRAIGGQTRFNTLAGALEIVDGILKLRGQWREWRLNEGGVSAPVLPTLHPAFLLRQSQAKREAWADFLAVALRLEGPPAQD